MSTNRKKNMNILGCCAMSLLLLLSGCQSASNNQFEDILTLKKSEEGRTQITVMSKHAFTILNFEKAVEEKFPDIDIVIVGNHSKEMGIYEYSNRLENHDITDIVMSWPLEVGEEYWEDNFMDLSGMEFTNRYNLAMLDEISKDGKLFYLPGPSQIRGIIYNKTMFEENGWQVPSDYEGFIELCHTIEASGIRALQLGMANPEVLDTAFIGWNYGDYFSDP